MVLLKYIDLLVSGALFAWGVLIKLDQYSMREAERRYMNWRQKTGANVDGTIKCNTVIIRDIDG